MRKNPRWSPQEVTGLNVHRHQNPRITNNKESRGVGGCVMENRICLDFAVRHITQEL